jgi:hypothetical protein
MEEKKDALHKLSIHMYIYSATEIVLDYWSENGSLYMIQ